jgi:hypothetical protein
LAALSTKPGHFGEKDLGPARLESTLEEDSTEQPIIASHAPHRRQDLKQRLSPKKEDENLYNMPV